MKKCKNVYVCGISALLSLALVACTASSREHDISVESSVSQTTEPETQATLSSTQFWDDVVELISLAGDTTTVYKLVDGRYLDRMDRYFVYDGVDTWTCDDGSSWSRKPDSDTSATNVYAEFAIERFLAQRPDHFFFSEGSKDASKVVLTFDTNVTNFRFLQLEGSFDSSGAYHCSQKQELYSKDEITTNDLMVVETNLDGLIPTRGISFVDAGGNTRYFYLALSGEDNVPLLISFN